MFNSIVHVDKVIDAQTVNGAATVSSGAIRVSYGEQFGLILRLSGDSPKVTLRYQVIESNVNDVNAVATGEDSGSAWITPSATGDIATAIIASLAVEFAPMVSKWIRLQVVGAADNGANTKATLFLSSYIL